METIAAIATALSTSGIAIIRLSGTDSVAIATRVFVAPHCSVADFEPRKLYLGTFSAHSTFDKCLCVRFEEPHSYTGEEIIEFQVHGGVKLAQNILEECLLAGARLATPGEFTRRAFLNGKLTLAQAEGTIDTINATSDAELHASYHLVSGGLSAKIETLRQLAIDIIATIEVVLDYPEEDLEAPTAPAVFTRTQALLEQVEQLLSTRNAGLIVTSGLNIALLGKPNVGKSSLFNAILGVERAIVTNIAGTTRDHLVESIMHRGVKFNFVDTAGLRESEDVIESVGIEGTRRVASGCDLALIIIDDTFGADDQEIIDSVHTEKIIVANKDDLHHAQSVADYSISAKTGNGVVALKDAIFARYLDAHLIEGGEILTNARHTAALAEARTALIDALSSPSLDLIPIDLRIVVKALGKIDGATVGVDVTNDIFSKFCLGK